MNKKWVTMGVVGVLILGGGYWGYKHIAKPVAVANITAKAKKGNVSKVISTSGQVTYPRAIPLTFQKDGQIVELNVKVGDSVTAGQVLARTNDTKPSSVVLQAQANVKDAQAELQTLQDSYNVRTKAQAQVALYKARQSLTIAKQKADPSYIANQITLAKQKVQQASNILAEAQQSRNASTIQSAQDALNQAIDDLTTANNLQNGGAAEALASAQAEVRAAQYQVDLQARGPKSGELQSAQAEIEKAKALLAIAQADLLDTQIIAPVNAVVVSAPLQLGKESNDNSFITVTPVTNNLEVEATIDQADMSQVELGQKVDITIDANANQHIIGTVSLVPPPQGTNVSKDTTITIAATLDHASDLLRVGMKANIHIIVAEAKEVLTVPSEAVQTRGKQTIVTVPVTSSASTYIVDPATQKSAKADNAANTGTENAVANVQYIPVEIGLDDGTNVEIRSGIEEGQEVIYNNSLSTTAKTTSLLGLDAGGNKGN